MGDDAFPLTTTLMKPFPQSNFRGEKKFLITSQQDPDGYLKMHLECIWNALANHLRVFRLPFALKPEKVKIILSNWLRSELCIGKIYIPQSLIGSEDNSHNVLPGIWRSDEPIESWFDLTPTRSKHSSNQANAGRQ